MADAKSHARTGPIALAAVALAASIANAVALSVLVPEQATRALVWGLALAAGPALVLVALAVARPALATAALLAFALASFVTGFSVGFWNLVAAVPLCIAAVAFALRRRRTA